MSEVEYLFNTCKFSVPACVMPLRFNNFYNNRTCREERIMGVLPPETPLARRTQQLTNTRTGLPAPRKSGSRIVRLLRIALVMLYRLRRAMLAMALPPQPQRITRSA